MAPNPKLKHPAAAPSLSLPSSGRGSPPTSGPASKRGQTSHRGQSSQRGGSGQDSKRGGGSSKKGSSASGAKSKAKGESTPATGAAAFEGFTNEATARPWALQLRSSRSLPTDLERGLVQISPPPQSRLCHPIVENGWRLLTGSAL
jgi:hypothetical protein